MKHILILVIGLILWLNLSPQSNGQVYNHSTRKKITISFNDSLSRGQDVKTILERSLLNYSPNEINILELKNVSTGEIFKNASFDAFVNLKNLTIVDSQISDFPETTFEKLNGLIDLYLSNIKLRSVSANLLKGMPKLLYLFLNNNNLEDLPADVFKNLPKIAVIDASGNHLKTLPKGIFQLAELVSLSVVNNVITTLEEGVFLAKILRKLNLSFNEVSRIDKHTFKNLDQLETIIMTRTFTAEVESLPKELFPNSRDLQEIRMNENHFKSLEAGIFHNLQKLKTLDISSNMLTKLTGNMFENNIHLRELNLAKNKLQYLPQNIFTNLSELLSLDLSNNKLGHLDAEIFSKLTRLTNFYISNNEVDLAVAGSANFSILKQCLNLTEIRAKNTNVSKIFTDWRENSKLRALDLTSSPLPLSEINAKFKSLVSFYFTSNNYTTVQFEVKPHMDVDQNAQIESILDRNLKCEQNGSSCSCKILYNFNDKIITLKCLRFNEDELGLWPYDVLEHSRQGYDIELILANCSLTSLYPVNKYVKEVKERVTKLVLSGNNLTTLIGLEEDLPALKELELDQNKFTTFDPTAVQLLKRSKNLTKITLHQNPWTCNCFMKDFYYFVKDNGNQIKQKDKITCSNIRDQPISELKFEDDFCPPDRRAITMVIISFAMLAFICFTLMYYYYTHEKKVKVWMFSKPILRFMVTEKELDRHKKYDAFISYATPDEWFVEQELVPKLERGERPYKLCIHQRDWHAGDYIPSQINRSVEESRRTIIVMSPNFLNSLWGKKEFETAYLKSMQERCSRILIILLEDIDKSKLDEEMKAYISTNTYLEWNDPWFWQKLKYALPHTYRIRCKRTREEMFIP